MDGALSGEVEALLGRAAAAGPIVFLTGAGISAESGIPTFRGPEGYWRVGSRNYHPQELATWEAFQEMPDEVWAWYLCRRSICRAAAPNAAHRAIADLEGALQDRLRLVTQNVDGLHLRAGSSLERTWQIHGNIDFMRCAAECRPAAFPVPEGIPAVWERERRVGGDERALLVCPRCAGPARPHVLWFDESYDEVHFKFESSIRAAGAAALLVVVGTSGSTNLPMQMAAIVARRGAPLLVLNPEPSPFSELAERDPEGLFVEGTAGALVPPVAERLARLAAR